MGCYRVVSYGACGNGINAAYNLSQCVCQNGTPSCNKGTFCVIDWEMDGYGPYCQ